MSGWTRRIIAVVSAANKDAANAAANHATWDGQGKGDQTFTTPLSADGKLPATHFWMSTAATPAMVAAMATRLKAQGAKDAEVALVPSKGTPASTEFVVFDGDLWAPDEVLAKLGLQRIGGTP